MEDWYKIIYGERWKMSWSLMKFGKRDAVAKAVKEELAKVTYLSGDEAALKDAAGEFAEKAIAAQGEKTILRVEMSGSGQQTQGVESKTQSVSINISPFYGFVE